jgi:bifunctional non-homologous end joining protein LigD
MENITLYFREGPSDKVYQASIHPKEQGYMVHFAYGRRGSTLSTGSKTQTPVAYPIAKGIYDKLIKEKLAKGYLPGAGSSVQVPVEGPRQHSGIQCQLLNPIEEQQAEALLSNPDYWMQEKMDGRRLLIQKQGGVITGINRLGLITSVPTPIVESAAKYRGNFIIDGEAVGDTLHAFDLLTICGEDMTKLRFAVRYLRLRDLLNAFDHPHIKIVETYCSPEMAGWYSQFKREGKEGVVFKHIDAPYIPGRPNSGGSQFKHKFYETASFIVAKANDKRSVSLILFENEKVRPAGNVTIPPNHDIPSPGTVVECRYLYAFKESGSIYQPVYLGSRDDIRSAECTTSQLKYKAEVMQAAA